MGSQHSLLKGLTIQLHQLCVGQIPGDTSDPFFLPQATHKTKKLVKDLLFHQDKVCTNSQICLLQIYPPDVKSQNSVSNCPIYDLTQSLETTYKRLVVMQRLQQLNTSITNGAKANSNSLTRFDKTISKHYMYVPSTYSDVTLTPHDGRWC